MAKHKEESIIKDIKQHFGFLFDKGYQICDVKYFQEAFGNWHVILESSKCYISIECDRNEIIVSFSPYKSGTKFIGLKAMIYYVSRGKKFVGYFDGNLAWSKRRQFEKLSDLLNEYHDQIAPLFEKGFEKLKEDMSLSLKRYSELLAEDYTRKFHAQEKLWTRRNLFLLPFRLLGIVSLAFLGWAVCIAFTAETNVIDKAIYSVVFIGIVIFLIVFIGRLLKSFNQS